MLPHSSRVSKPRDARRKDGRVARSAELPYNPPRGAFARSRESMELVATKSKLSGEVAMPGSKSHTIRGLIIGLLAEGESRLLRPLASNDTQSCVRLCRALGADVDTSEPGLWGIVGTAGHPTAPAEPVIAAATRKKVALEKSAGTAFSNAGYLWPPGTLKRCRSSDTSNLMPASSSQRHVIAT